MDPLLTIAIPTYNRASYLDHLCLELSQALVNCDSGDYEILILDNCSTDGTDLVCDKYASGVSGFRVIRHQENIGLSRNFKKAYEMARGDYVWLLCDDDAVDVNAVSLVLSAIRAGGGISCFLLNRNIYDLGMGKVIRANCLNLTGSVLIDSEFDKIKYCGEFLTASCSVIRRSAALLGLKCPEFYGTFCETLVLGLTALKIGPGMILGDVFVRYRDGNNGSWNAYWPLIHVYYMPKVVNALMGGDGRAMRCFIGGRDNSIVYNYCYLASTRNKKILSLVDRRGMRRMYAHVPNGDLIYSFSFDMPIWVPRFFVLFSSLVRLWRVESGGVLGVRGYLLLLRNIWGRYGKFINKESA